MVSRRCRACAEHIALDARFCQACGAEQVVVEATVVKPRRWGCAFGILLLAGATTFGLLPHNGEPRWTQWWESVQQLSQADGPVPEPVVPSQPPREPLAPQADEAPPELAEGLSLTTSEPHPLLRDRFVTEVHQVRGDRRGTQAIEIRFDPARVRQPVAYKVIANVLTLPVEATIRNGVARIEADISMRRPAEGTFFLQASQRVPPPVPGIGYAIGEAWENASHPRCQSGAVGETDFPRGARIAVGFLEAADCGLAQRVRDLLEEALDHYGREFADAQGSPLRRYTPERPLMVFLHRQAGVNGAYSIWSAFGHMYIDIDAARDDPEGLRETMFHETFHAVQDHYATMSGTGVMGSHWWFEGSAEWAGLVARGIDFDAAIPIEFRESGILSVGLARTSRFGTMSYATSLHMYWAEQREPGFVLRMLQSDTARGAAFVEATHQACGFPEAYPEFVRHVATTAPNVWSRGRFMVTDRGVRVQQSTEPNAGVGAAQVRPWSDPEPGMDRAVPWFHESLSFVAEPFTAQFVQFNVRSSEPVRLTVQSSTSNVFALGSTLVQSGELWRIEPLSNTTLVFFNDHPTNNERIRAFFVFERGEEEEEPPEPPQPPEPPRVAVNSMMSTPMTTMSTTTMRGRSMTGAWRFNMGCMNLTQNSSSVSGETFGHRHRDTGRARGTIRDGVLTLTYNVGTTERTTRIRLSDATRTEVRGTDSHHFTRAQQCQRAPDTSMRCYDACIAGCELGMFACGVNGERVTPRVYCDGIQSQTRRAGSGMGFFFECFPHMPQSWRTPREVPVPGTRSLVPRVNPNGRRRR